MADVCICVCVCLSYIHVRQYVFIKIKLLAGKSETKIHLCDLHLE